MHQGKLVFAQVIAHLPLSTFRRCVARYNGEHKVKRFAFLDQFDAMAIAQLTFRDSLRDIESCLATQRSWLYQMSFRAPVARNTLANANAVRPWPIDADLAQYTDVDLCGALIPESRWLHCARSDVLGTVNAHR